MPSSILFRILSVGLGLLVPMVCLEIVLRFLPVHGGSHRQPVGPRHPVLRYESNRVFTWSAGPAFHMVNTVKTNNYGFINTQDYVEEGNSPLLAVIGDSYVEAIQVKFRETIKGRLAEQLEGKTRVYSFALSGSPLSQYLVYAEYAVQRFYANALVISVVGNDFDEPLEV